MLTCDATDASGAILFRCIKSIKRRCVATVWPSQHARLLPAMCREVRGGWAVQVTPVWRAGPNGPKTLCNACGVRYMKTVKPRR